MLFNITVSNNGTATSNASNTGTAAFVNHWLTVELMGRWLVNLDTALFFLFYRCFILVLLLDSYVFE
jgi:hypothetical protein